MADLTDGLLRYLAGAGLITYDPDGTSGDAFCDVMPPAPDEAVCLTLYGGGTPAAAMPYDNPSVQVRVRGGADPRPARARAWAIYAALHGLSAVTLPDGTWLVDCTANQTPSSLGQDSSGRIEYVTNYSVEVYAPSTHRPA